MKRIKVIKRDQMPAQPFRVIVLMIAAYLFLERVNAREFVYGAVGLFLGLVLIASCVRAIRQEETDVFDRSNDTEEKK